VTELQRDRATFATLTGTLEEKGKALEEKVVALQKVEAALKEKEDSLSTLEEAARVQQEEAQGAITGKYLGFCCCLILFYHNLSWFPCSELKKAVANETAEKEAINTALTAAHDEYAELEQTAVNVCQELEEAGALSGSSVVSRLRALGGLITEHTKSTFRLSVLRALDMASTHYDMDLLLVSSGYVVTTDANADTASAIMDDADAAAEEFATTLTKKLKADIPPIAEFDAVEDPLRGEDNL
jgi:hypothetical protein